MSYFLFCPADGDINFLLPLTTTGAELSFTFATYVCSCFDVSRKCSSCVKNSDIAILNVDINRSHWPPVNVFILLLTGFDMRVCRIYFCFLITKQRSLRVIKSDKNILYFEQELWHARILARIFIADIAFMGKKYLVLIALHVLFVCFALEHQTVGFKENVGRSSTRTK